VKRIATLAALALSALWTSEASAQNRYAAIAFNKETGASGRSYRYPDRSGAEERALQECGRGCAVVAWVRNQCLVLAVGSGNGYGYSMAVNESRAASGALAQCRTRTSGCRVSLGACSN
jgi:hypothetical protein